LLKTEFVVDAFYVSPFGSLKSMPIGNVPITSGRYIYKKYFLEVCMYRMLSVILVVLLGLASCAPSASLNASESPNLSEPVVRTLDAISPPLPDGAEFDDQILLSYVPSPGSPALEFVGEESDVFVAVQDSLGNVLTDYQGITPGYYVVTFSKGGFQTRISKIIVEANQRVKVSVPRLIPGTNLLSQASIAFSGNTISLTVVMINLSTNIFVTDIAALQSGMYRIVFLKRGYDPESVTVNPRDGIVVVVQTTVPTPIVNTPSASPPNTPASGYCWVNGYTRKDGTRVSGYYRRC
jgi:hypothetical protein